MSLFVWHLYVDLPVLGLIEEVNKDGIFFFVVGALLHVGL
jgi:hypothetical protein